MRFEVTASKSGEKVHTFTWAPSLQEAINRVNVEAFNHPETWAGWTFEVK